QGANVPADALGDRKGGAIIGRVGDTITGADPLLRRLQIGVRLVQRLQRDLSCDVGIDGVQRHRFATLSFFGVLPGESSKARKDESKVKTSRKGETICLVRVGPIQDKARPAAGRSGWLDDVERLAGTEEFETRTKCRLENIPDLFCPDCGRARCDRLDCRPALAACRIEVPISEAP